MINRRTAVQLMSVALIAGCGRRTPASASMKVTVVGAGIVGASIAYHLAKAGAAVTVIDKDGPATHASRGTFAWINATWAKQPKAYHALNQAGVSSWAVLQEELGLPVKWGGSLEWFSTESRQQRLGEQIAEQVAWGEPAEMLSGDRLAALEPHVNFSGTETAAYSPNDGAVDPVLATEVLLKAAGAYGAELKTPCELLEISRDSNGQTQVETSLGKFAADRIILATGAAPDVAERFAGLAVPQRITPGVIAITKPMPALLCRVISAPGVHMHQRTNGRFVLGEQDGAPQNEAHAMRLKDRPRVFPSDAFAEQHFYRILNVAETVLPAIAEAELETAYIGWRPLPLDGHPVLGMSAERPGVYIAIMHSGVSLAPIIGQLVAHEVLSDAPNPELSAYRPERTFETVKRY